MAYRHANLEHAAASAENLLMAAFIIVMLAFPLLGLTLPQAAIGGVHPASIMMLLAYAQGMRMISGTHTTPMWLPRPTRETHEESSQAMKPSTSSLSSLWLRFTLAGGMTALAGWLLARAAVPITLHTGLSETLVGGVLTGLAGSLPELVTALAAVRMGALSLAVGDILGGNCFDALIVGFADLAHPGASIYAAVGPQQDFLLALTVLLSAVLLMGLVYREKHGFANIGLESFLVLLFYLGGITLLLILA
jgi:cation:H+ antiporter